MICRRHAALLHQMLEPNVGRGSANFYQIASKLCQEIVTKATMFVTTSQSSAFEGGHVRIWDTAKWEFFMGFPDVLLNQFDCL